MSDLADYGLDLATLTQMYEEWRAGASKTDIEQRYLHRTQSHGKLFSSLVHRYLGHAIEKQHPLSVEVGRLREENRRLRAKLLAHGVDPDGS